MDKSVAKLLRKNSLVCTGDRVLLALSGGADSVALLHILASLAPEFPFSLSAAHLDHSIRAESHGDADFVRALCADLGVPLVIKRVDVPSLAGSSKMGLEEAGRMARRDFLERLALDMNIDVIALAHHRDDQAETFLHRLLRGTGLTGLAAMRLKSGSYIRPLLNYCRSDIRDYLKRESLTWVEDPSNKDLAFTRNRIRHELFPLLTTFNPRVSESLASLTRRIALEEEFWQGEVDRTLARMMNKSPGGVELSLGPLNELHPALRARIFREVLRRVRGDLQGVEAVHVENMERLCQGKRPQADLDLPGAWVGRRYESLIVASTPPEIPRLYEIRIDASGDYSLPCEGVLRVLFEDEPRGEGAWVAEFDADAVVFPIYVRSFRPGDRFHPRGAPGSKKLKKFFIDKKIDIDTRCRLPIVVSDSVLWIPGVRRCDGFLPGKGRGKVLRLEFRGGEMSTIHL